MAPSDQNRYFNRYVALLAMAGEPEFVDFLAEARPQVVQMGFYGPQMYGLAGTEAGGGYPMRLPVQGIREVLDWQKDFNQKVHELGGKVLGHFTMTIAWGTPDPKEGFPQFYDEHWPTDLLGEKPVADISELLQRLPDGEILVGDRYDFPWVVGCNNSPHWLELHKRMVRVAINECDVDGFVSLYNYNHGCACEYCNRGFRAYLTERYTAAEIQEQFNIDDLDAFQLDGKLGKVAGWVDKESPHPVALQVEAMRFSQVSWKRHYDEIFIEVGRELKPDLILGSWNHLGYLSTGEERNVMPKELWGREEDLLWYSTGGNAGTVADGDAGTRLLNLRYIRELSDGKLPVLGGYEGTRIRASIAEGLANQGPGMGLYCTWNDAIGRKAFLDYFRFAEKYEEYYHPVESYSEVALVFPRQALQIGDDEPVETFRQLGQTLLDAHILFDVVSDEKLSNQRLAEYDAVIVADPKALSREQCTMLEEYAHNTRSLIVIGEPPATASDEGILTLPTLDRAVLIDSLKGMSEINAPWTVRVNAFAQPGRIILHFVNYNREETDEGGPANENPIGATDMSVDLKLHISAIRETKVTKVRLLSPDVPQDAELSWEQVENSVRFRVPSVLVYGVVVIELER